MDETTNTTDSTGIIASNLTIAYCAANPAVKDEEEIIKVYERFRELLLKPKGDRYDENESRSYTGRGY